MRKGPVSKDAGPLSFAAMDYLQPDYAPLLRQRAARLQSLRGDKTGKLLGSVRTHYRDNPIDFVVDWGMTFDPRNIERGLPSMVPFVPFQRQIEWMQWLLDRWKAGENGITEKTRDMGCSVSAMSLFGALCLFNRDFVAGVGSRKEMLVDNGGDPNTLFHKARTFLSYVPHEFRGGWSADNKVTSSHMKLMIPSTGSVIIGEAGDNIGRGGRASIYLVDESAHNRNQKAVDMALSQTTRCRQDLSSVNGTDNAFAEKRFSGRVPVFTFHWRDDPRKGQEWYDRECARLPPVIVAQEIDIDYHASKEGLLIPSAWVQAAIDAHKVLGAAADGSRKGALDVADEGTDKNAFAVRQGILLDHIEEWSGVGSDLFATSERASLICDLRGLSEFDYDADGLGAGVRGDMRIINAREARATRQITATGFQGSGSVVDPDAFAIEPDHKDGHNGRTNRDFFANRKAQAWWALRRRFEATYRQVVMKQAGNVADCIVLPSRLPELLKLTTELCQPSYSINTAGKIVVNKKPDGTPSPNLADAVMIAFAPAERKRVSAFDF